MTWNIKKGGRGRLDAIAEVIQGERPDLLALQELRGLDPSFAGRIGMTAHVAGSVFGQPVAVLVRPPLRIESGQSVRWRLHHAAAVARVDTGAGRLTVVSTHLNPFSSYRRMREARWLAARYGSKRRPVLLAGDLNSLDPATDHTDELARLGDRYRRRHLAADGTVDTRAIAAFTGGRFTDLWAAVGEGDRATAPTSQGGGPEFSGMRLDYLMATRPVAARAVRVHVVRGGAAEYASDHYPVLADLD